MWETTIRKLRIRPIFRLVCKYLTPEVLNIILGSLVIYLLIVQYMDKNNSKIFAPIYTDYSVNATHSGPILLCMVLTTPENYITKAVHVKATWGRRCDHLVFISSSERGLMSWLIAPESTPDIPVRELSGVNGRNNLWGKVKLGLGLVWREYAGKFDFLIKADDDTFLIVDNLKHLLSSMSSKEPFILGHHQEDDGVEYMSGGSGYVLSHAAVQEVVEEGLGGDQPCHLPHPVGKEVKVYPNEDLQMGKCAAILNIKFYSSEINGQSSFLPFSIAELLVPDLRPWWWVPRTKECKDKVQCLTKSLISMHYVSPEMMYVYDYFTHAFTREK